MKKSIWIGGAKVSMPKPSEHKALSLTDCVTLPLYIDRNDPMGAMVLDQQGKSVYSVAMGRLCLWCKQVLSAEDQAQLLKIVNDVLNAEWGKP